jgi:hypothetical protein
MNRKKALEQGQNALTHSNSAANLREALRKVVDALIDAEDEIERLGWDITEIYERNDL